MTKAKLDVLIRISIMLYLYCYFFFFQLSGYRFIRYSIGIFNREVSNRSRNNAISGRDMYHSHVFLNG